MRSTDFWFLITHRVTIKDFSTTTTYIPKLNECARNANPQSGNGAAMKAAVIYHGWDETEDPGKLSFLVRRAVERRSSWGHYYQGMMHYDGMTCTSGKTALNYSAAAKHLTPAAIGGLALAQHDLGLCYLLGHGVEKNGDTALHWFKRGAKQGLAQSIYMVGYCYAGGHGVEQNFKRARFHYRKAQSRGLPGMQRYIDELPL